MADLRQRLLAGSIWIIGAKVVTNALGLLSTLVLARLLRPADFGLVAIGVTLLGLVSSVTDIALTEALVQHKNPTPAHFHTAWTLNLLRASCVAALFASAAWPVERAWHDPRIADVMLTLAVGVVVNGLENPRAIMMTRSLVFWQQFMLQVTNRLVALVVAVAIAVIARSYWALLLGTLAGQTVAVAVSYTVLPFRPRLRLTHTKELLGFSLWLTGCQIVNTINWRLDALLIGTWSTRAALGFYTVGDNLASLPTREATAPLTGTLFPAFATFAGDRVRLAAAYLRAQGVVALIACPIGIGVASIASPLVAVCLGPHWAPVTLVIAVLAPMAALMSLGNIAQPLALAVGETALLFRRDLQSLLLRAPCIVAGMAIDGFRGIVYARLATGAAGILLNMAVVRRVTGLSFAGQVLPNARVLAASAVMAVAIAAIGRVGPAGQTFADDIVRIAAATITGAISYGGALLLLWRLVGRPDGAEREMVGLAARAGAMFRPSPVASRP